MFQRGVRQFILVSSLALLIVFLSACQQTGGEQTNAPQDPFVGGTAGLEFAFQEDEPPAVVLDNSQQEFFITLLVRNRGEHTIPAGGVIASLSGVDASAFGLSSLDVKNAVEVEGMSKDQEFTIEGAEVLLDFEGANYVDDVPADFSLTLRSDLCYAYETKAVASLCMKQNVLRQSVEDVCEVNVPQVGVFNSGGPIQISNLRQSAVGSSKVKVTFTVTNVGNGLVYLPDTFTSSCRGNDDRRDRVHVTLENPRNAFSVECSSFGKSNSGEVRLVNKRKEISCTIDTSGMQEVTFQETLFITVDYMYREAVTTPLLIRNSL